MTQISDATPLKTTPLTQRHIEHGGRMVPFAGYNMPVQFVGVRQEHQAVRENVGLFDVSHMGEVSIQGEGALAFLNRVITHDASTLEDGQALYCVMCHESGGVVDDLLVYRLGEEDYLLCINAANRHKDVNHILGLERPESVEVTDTSDSWAQLALQGPRAIEMLAPLCEGVDPKELDSFWCAWGQVAGVTCLVSRTGYTGEDGVELYVPAKDAVQVYDALVERGQAYDMALCGLGCRDTLRLEAKLHLYGQDLTDETTPLEAGLSWTVKLAKEDFVGRQALLAQKEAGVPRRLRGLFLEGRAIARTGTPLFVGDKEVGWVTSGCHSVTLGQSIALGYIEAEFASMPEIEVEIRGRRVKAQITKKPFYRRPAAP